MLEAFDSREVVEVATGIWMMKMPLPLLVEERLKSAN